MDMVLITGMSGSGKSVALHALEDAGYYCVDNLPPELLDSFVALELKHGARRVAIAMDVRSGASLPLVPAQLPVLRAQGIVVQSIFLDASTDTLVRRYSETRRLHGRGSHHSRRRGRRRFHAAPKRAAAVHLRLTFWRCCRAAAHRAGFLSDP